MASSSQGTASQSTSKSADNPHNVDTSIFTRPADIAAVSCFDDNVASFYYPNIAVKFSNAVETYTTDLCQTFEYAARIVKTFKALVMHECVFQGAIKADKWYHFNQEFVSITLALKYQADVAVGRKTRDVFFDVMKVRNKYKLAKIAEDVDSLSRALGIDTTAPQVMNPVVQFFRDLSSKDPGKCYIPLLDIKLRIQRYVGRLVWLLIDFFLHLTEKAGVPNAGLKKAKKSRYSGSKPADKENGENVHDNTASNQDESNSPTEKTSPAQASPSASENCQDGHCDSSDPLTEEETAVYNEMTQASLEVLAHWFEKMALMSIRFLYGLERGTQIPIDSSLKAKILQLLHVIVLTPPRFSM